MFNEVRERALTQLFSYSIIIILAIVCVLLTLQNRDLKNTLRGMTLVSQQAPLKQGERIEAFKIQTLDGATNDIAFNDPDKKYLLFVFSTSCPHCEKTLPVWQSLAKESHDNCYILGVSLQDLNETKKYVNAKHVDFYTGFTSGDTSFNRKYKISGVPETILIDGNGLVEKAWIGELTTDQVNEIRDLTSVPKLLAN